MTSKLYSTKDAYDIYVYYLALKRHFTSNYDYFKYNGKVKANLMSFENRKDKFFFYKLSKKSEAKDLILANMIVDPSMWIGDMLEDPAYQNYIAWAKRIQALTYNFKLELNYLNEKFDSNIVVDRGHHPTLLTLYIQKQISPETLVILDDLTKCFIYWDKKIHEKLMFPHINTFVQNYKPFLNYDKDKMKKIVVDKFKHTS